MDWNTSSHKMNTEICDLQGHYAALSPNSVPTFRDNLVPKLRYVITTLRCAISQNTADLICIAVAAWNHASWTFFVVFQYVKKVIHYWSIHMVGEFSERDFMSLVIRLPKVYRKRPTTNFLTYVINVSDVPCFHFKALVSVCCVRWFSVLLVTKSHSRNVSHCHVWDSYWILTAYVDDFFRHTQWLQRPRHWCFG